MVCVAVYVAAGLTGSLVVEEEVFEGLGERVWEEDLVDGVGNSESPGVCGGFGSGEC